MLMNERRSDEEIVRLLAILDGFKDTAMDPVYQITKDILPIVVEDLNVDGERYTAAAEAAVARVRETPVDDILTALRTMDDLIITLNSNVRKLLALEVLGRDPVRALQYILESAANLGGAQRRAEEQLRREGDEA